VQLYHTDWDHHGDTVNHLGGPLEKVCLETDRACAALVLDLKRRGLLEDTLVVWGGEFGRTPMGEVRELVGRNHHIDTFPMWFAGGGVKKGLVHGETDAFGFAPVSGRVHVHDVQATVLHLCGIDHKKLTFRFQGRDFRLTDVHGELMTPILV
jgi:arylsulfatase A-like enzyme